MLTRREMLRRAGLLGLATVALQACGPKTPESAGQTAPAPTSPAPASPVPPTAELSAAATIEPSPVPSPTATRVPPSPTPDQAYMAVVKGSSPEAITRAAVAALGGMGRFVKGGDDVIVKPNICIASYSYEYAATTNPEVVATVVRMCLESGAARVRVMDLPFSGTAAEAYKVSGIRAAVEGAGGHMEIMNLNRYQEYQFPSTAKNIKTWKIYPEVMNANVLINIPIAKVHDAAILTLGLKNLMGVVLNRSNIHWALHQCIADLNTLIKPSLTILDAVRVLTKHGPQGGNLDWVYQANTVVASHDIVAVDSYGAQTFFKYAPEKVSYIKFANDMGLGTMDIGNLRVKELSL